MLVNAMFSDAYYSSAAFETFFRSLYFLSILLNASMILWIGRHCDENGIPIWFSKLKNHSAVEYSSKVLRIAAFILLGILIVSLLSMNWGRTLQLAEIAFPGIRSMFGPFVP
jgi:hypothetical protein